MKFTKDGKKVVVVGQLNNEETIVQEVFVTDSGDEIPGGERFVTKALFDEPVRSWYDNELDRKKESIIRISNEISNLDDRHRQMQVQVANISAILRNNVQLQEKLPAANLAAICDFLSGNIKWVLFTPEYGAYELQPFGQAIAGEERYSSPLRLMSALGKSNGDIQFGISQYDDGSGSHKAVEFFPTEEHGLKRMSELATSKIEAGKLSVADYQRLVTRGCQFSEEAVSFLRARAEEMAEKNVEQLKANFCKQMDAATKARDKELVILGQERGEE